MVVGCWRRNVTGSVVDGRWLLVVSCWHRNVTVPVVDGCWLLAPERNRPGCDGGLASGDAYLPGGGMMGDNDWMHLCMRRLLLCSFLFILCCLQASADVVQVLDLSEIDSEPKALDLEADGSGVYTWRLPSDPSRLILPIAAGIVVETSDRSMMRWLREQGPWTLSQLPVLGAVYGNRMLTVIVPWPHYAELSIAEPIEIRYRFPKGREGATPSGIVARVDVSEDPLEVARVFRRWRRSAEDLGAIPAVRNLEKKREALPEVARLFGAPHFYLWGPALFSRHDVREGKWTEFARRLRDSEPESFGGAIVSRFSNTQREALDQLAESEWPTRYLTVLVAGAMDTALAESVRKPEIPRASRGRAVAENCEGLASEFPGLLNPPRSWGDGLSIPMLEALKEGGVERALLVLSDLYQASPRPDVADLAGQMGFLLGPYDSYHSVHSPEADPDATWETAQFDRQAYVDGRVLNQDGTGHSGFRGRGYHFSPLAAWPYVRERVDRIADAVGYSTWFVDCDATAECFDDFSPGRQATRVDDINARRQRLEWLETTRGMVVGSEEGSVLFSDLIHYGHGVQTPYLGHLDPQFRDRKSPYFLGGYWPPDQPAQSFQPVPVVPSLRSPFFDPRVRIPLYRAAIGDEIVATHHWSFDSLKFSDVAVIRELMEILYMVPPMYHLNRGVWPERRGSIRKHLEFWGPLHERLATAVLERFDWLTGDRLVQRASYRSAEGMVTFTANFDTRVREGFPPQSVSVSGDIRFQDDIYRAAGQ
ncbi:MAG: hypothetical protein JSU96_20565 [Acidobacteriota bacterium]|nr:MAG: hypothetical protein JSU96_20565 [Acidobacteriota bacterium]